MRMTTGAERRLLARLAEALAPDAKEPLRRQIETARIRSEERGHLSFFLPGDTAGLPSSDVDVIESSYRDADGTAVELLLHFEQPRAVMSWLEWFRYDGRPPGRFPPPADALADPVARLMP
jgi:hypothetical protein